MLNQAGDGWVPAGDEKDAFSTGLLQSVGQGLTLGFADELSAGLSAGVHTLFTDDAGTFGEEYDLALESYRDRMASYAVDNPGLALGAEVAGGALTGGASLGRVLAGRGLKAAAGVGAAEGAVYGAGAADTGVGESRTDGALEGAVTGVATGAISHGVGKLLGRVFDSARSIDRKINEVEFNASSQKTQQTQQAPEGNKSDILVGDDAQSILENARGSNSILPSAQSAIDQGYDLSPGQKFGGKQLLGKEEALIKRSGGSPWLEAKMDFNQRLLNQKVAGTIGLRGVSNLGESHLGQAVDNITSAMGQLTMQDGVDRIFTVRPAFVDRITEIEDSYVKSYGASNRVSKILEAAKLDYSGGQISARRIQETHSDAGLDMINAKYGPDRRAYGALREVMDDIMENNMQKGSKAEWQKLRQQWSNLQVLLRPGVISKEGAGNVSPFVLANKLRQANPLGFATGKPDVRLSELSEISKHANKAMQQPATSRTAEALLGVQNLQSPVRGVLDSVMGSVQEIPLRIAPNLTVQEPVGTGGLLGGLTSYIQGGGE